MSKLHKELECKNFLKAFSLHLNCQSHTSNVMFVGITNILLQYHSCIFSCNVYWGIIHWLCLCCLLFFFFISPSLLHPPSTAHDQRSHHTAKNCSHWQTHYIGNAFIAKGGPSCRLACGKQVHVYACAKPNIT